jgi:hypothetical protein
MDLPINYSTDPAVIAEEAARFRGMSPEERLHEIHRVADR